MDAKTAVQRLASASSATTPDQMKQRAQEMLAGLGDLVKQYVYGRLHPGASSANVRPNSFAGHIEVEATTETLAVSMPGYAESIDRGRKEGGRKVPIAALLKWLAARGVTPRRNQTLNSIAFAVQNAIYLHGIKARPFLVGTEEYLSQLVDALIDDVLLPELVGMLDDKFPD
ncbi:hypothetical protein Q5H93_06220 [Hymenobacter sp. ASUV-10]|uniref:Uncharacterized protein n=1 Tax=Hymenobacter aranciens TaxID=3063996 RepID=A0ABT9B7R5_9BACT|nr:hypothetical protein [Hymenobacter sp. ASUV-10]MDO7874321.1 hypothetical protein [Hymenobacter sp. ASUV-10]